MDKMDIVGPRCAQLEILRTMYEPNYRSRTGDVVFLVDGERFPAHRAVVAAASKSLYAMLYNGLHESKADIINIEQTGKDSFRRILQYIYVGTIENGDLDDMKLFIRAADMHSLVALKDILQEHISNAFCNSQFEVGAAIDLYTFGCNFGFDVIRDEVTRKCKKELSKDNVPSVNKIAYDVFKEILKIGVHGELNEMRRKHQV